MPPLSRPTRPLRGLSLARGESGCLEAGCPRCLALPAPFGGLTWQKTKAAAWSLGFYDKRSPSGVPPLSRPLGEAGKLKIFPGKHRFYRYRFGTERK